MAGRIAPQPIDQGGGMGHHPYLGAAGGCTDQAPQRFQQYQWGGASGKEGKWQRVVAMGAMEAMPQAATVVTIPTRMSS